MCDRVSASVPATCLSAHISIEVHACRSPHSLVLNRPALLNLASRPVNSDAGPLNSCRVLRRRLASLEATCK